MLRTAGAFQGFAVKPGGWSCRADREAEVLFLLSRLEVFSNIVSQIERAIQLGQDHIVEDLDREIDPILEDILLYKATNTAELHGQLKFITDLLVRRSDDAATVVRLSAKLSELIAHYFQDGKLRYGADDAARAPVMEIPLVTQGDQPAQAPAVARVAVVSMDYRFLYCNAVMAEDLNRSPRTLVGRPVSEFCDMSVFESAYRTHLDMCFAGEFREFEAPSLAGRSSGRFTIRLTPLRNIERRITGAVMVAQSDMAVPAEVGH